MRPVDQTVFGEPDGNCFDACVASVFETTLADVPHFNAHGGRWFDEFRRWLQLRYELIPMMFKTEDPSEHTHDAIVLVGGLNFDGVMHSVVYRNGVMLHDPNPNRRGLREVQDVIVFVAIDPARTNETVEDVEIDYTRESRWQHPLDTECPECGEKQFTCPSGTSCPNGHGY